MKHREIRLNVNIKANSILLL